MSEKIIIFDTTLRDGEQAPGASLNQKEKLEVASALCDLGVDIIEAGFPISSKGDLVLSLDLKYRYTDYERKEDSRTEAVRLAFKYKF